MKAFPAPAGMWITCHWKDGRDLEKYPVMAIAIALDPSADTVEAGLASLDNPERMAHLLVALQENRVGRVPAKYITNLMIPGTAMPYCCEACGAAVPPHTPLYWMRVGGEIWLCRLCEMCAEVA